MSTSGDDAASVDRDALRRLEQVVARALQRIRDLESRLAEAERRATDLDQVLFDVTGGDLEPTVFVDSLRGLREENEQLRERLARGRDGVERLLAKIRFLEEQR
jgi:hypothetical protein